LLQGGGITYSSAILNISKLSDLNMNANWNYPTAIRAGNGRINELAAVCAELGMSRPLLVTDPGLRQLPMLDNIVGQCRSNGLEIQVFSDIKANPTGANVNDGVAAYKQGDCDGVVALGGGSGLDAGKAIALMAHQSVSIWDLEDIGDNFTRADASKIAPIIGVPTTAGTGSEVGRASVIVDEAAHLKKIIFHPLMLPGVVILDPGLTVGLPAGLTAATGMDALSHSLEAYCSPLFHPMAEGIAVEGMRLVKNWLPHVVENGADIDARMQMLVASSMGATAFQRGLGAMHALAHPLGAIYDAHHGTLNAILMPYVLNANRDVIQKPMQILARYLDLPTAGFDGVMRWILDLRASIGIPNTLNEIGIGHERQDDMGPLAVADPSSGSNPIQFTADQYSDILGKAVDGVL
jgi:alcohol dehydrogenase class IV